MTDGDEKLDRDAIYKESKQVMNLPPRELSEWLETDDSKSAGWKGDAGGETVGHASGRRIVQIKKKKKADLTDDDYRHMRKVIGYVHRHVVQGGPAEDKRDSRWRHSLMNWGHDPLRKD